MKIHDFGFKKKLMIQFQVYKPPQQHYNLHNNITISSEKNLPIDKIEKIAIFFSPPDLTKYIHPRLRYISKRDYVRIQLHTKIL